MIALQKLFLAGVTALFLVGCTDSNKQPVEAVSAVPSASDQARQELVGTYVSDMYEKRDEGYDWVGIRVEQQSEYQLDITVRSRADKKRPTCTYDAVAERIEERVYQTVFEGEPILFTFSDDALSVAPKDTANRDLLYYFCSGGGSLAGTYRKIEGSWDDSQVDPTLYTGRVETEDFSFFVRSEPQGEKISIQVQKIDARDHQNYEERETLVDANIIGIQAADVDGSGLPELLIYLYDEPESSGNIVAYTVTDDRKLATFDFPEIDDEFKAYPDTVFTANGNEPGWGIVLEKEGAQNLAYHFIWDWGNTRLAGRAIPLHLDNVEGGRSFALINPMDAVFFTIKTEQCFDDSDKAHSASVTLLVGDRTYYGCGGYRMKE